MWLWYLELYVAVLMAFLLGAGVGLLVARLLVRRTSGFSLGLDSPGRSSDAGTSAPSPGVSP